MHLAGAISAKAPRAALALTPAGGRGGTDGWRSASRDEQWALLAVDRSRSDALTTIIGVRRDAPGADDAERTFVIFMCAYAGDVLSGIPPGRYSDEDARRYARVCLIPEELLERETIDIDRTARALRIAAGELCAARAARLGLPAGDSPD